MIFKSHYKHYKHYKPFDSTTIIIIKCIILGTFGLILGIIINNIVIYLSNSLYIKNRFLQNILQVILCSITIAVLHTSSRLVGWVLHNTIPGFFFLSLLFNVQYKLIDNIQNTYLINNNTDIKKNEK
jgi:hypothetical protein